MFIFFFSDYCLPSLHPSIRHSGGGTNPEQVIHFNEENKKAVGKFLVEFILFSVIIKPFKD